MTEIEIDISGESGVKSALRAIAELFSPAARDIFFRDYSEIGRAVSRRISAILTENPAARKMNLRLNDFSKTLKIGLQSVVLESRDESGNVFLRAGESSSPMIGIVFSRFFGVGSQKSVVGFVPDRAEKIEILSRGGLFIGQNSAPFRSFEAGIVFVQNPDEVRIALETTAETPKTLLRGDARAIASGAYFCSFF